MHAKRPELTGKALAAVSTNPWVIFFLVNMILFVLGTFLDMAATILICTPILLPVVKAMGVDPVHFGVVAVVNINNVPPVAVYGWASLGLWGLAFVTFFIPEAIAVLTLSLVNIIGTRWAAWTQNITMASSHTVGWVRAARRPIRNPCARRSSTSRRAPTC